MTDEDIWGDIMPSLRSIGQVISGNTSGSVTISGIASDILPQVPDRFALIGFSMGGYVARELARLVPARVQALVLIATSARADTPAETLRKTAAARSVDPDRFGGVSRAAAIRSLHPELADNEALIERIRKMSERVGGDIFKRQAAAVREGDLDRLAVIRCPTLVVAGDCDRLRSIKEAEELRDGISGATMAVIRRSGHMIPMEQPAALLAAMAPWLKAHVQQ